MTDITQIDHVTQAEKQLVTQYKDSTNLKNYIKTFTTQDNEIEQALFDLLNKRHLDVAEGRQLDVIGRILGLNRIFLGGIQLTDSEYRVLLKAKILKNHTRCTMEQLVEIYVIIFNATIDIRDSPGVMRLYVGRPLTPNEILYFSVIDERGQWLMPKPNGIRLEVYTYDPDNYFGFFGDPNAKGFNIGKFAGRVA